MLVTRKDCSVSKLHMGCRILKEERNYILQMIKKIRASGANVLLIQKSILRDAVTDLSLHYLVCSCTLLDIVIRGSIMASEGQQKCPGTAEDGVGQVYPEWQARQWL